MPPDAFGANVQVLDTLQRRSRKNDADEQESFGLLGDDGIALCFAERFGDHYRSAPEWDRCEFEKPHASSLKSRRFCRVSLDDDVCWNRGNAVLAVSDGTHCAHG